MRKRTIYITEYDLERLSELLLNSAGGDDYGGRDDLKKLEVALDRGKVLTPKDIPKDVITMNSKVILIELESGKEITCTLVFPNEADIDHYKISILAPIGTAMLGYHVGDTFAWKVPAGVKRFKVKEILYQPEAAGDYHL
ncbi:nucleoside diphosphate kinase regulator [Thermodesulfobacteriota bacterium]